MIRSFRHKGLQRFFETGARTGIAPAHAAKLARQLSALHRAMAMHQPPHPGSLLKEDVLPALGLSLTQAAAQLGVSRVQLSRFIHGHAAVTPDLAIPLAKWIPAPTAIMWLQMQADYDLWQAEHSGRVWQVQPAHQ